MPRLLTVRPKGVMLMRRGRQEILLTLVALSLLFLAPAAVLGQASGALDLGSLLHERDPETLISSLKDKAQEKDARERWAQMVTLGSQAAVKRNQEDLYPNPSLQAYVNRLGQSLIPKEASDN